MKRLVLLMTALFFLIVSCITNSITAEQEVTLISEEQEIQMGAQSPPKFETAFDGLVYLACGLVVLMESDRELAAVIGHEIGHISAKHSLVSLRRDSRRSGPEGSDLVVMFSTHPLAGKRNSAAEKTVGQDHPEAPEDSPRSSGDFKYAKALSIKIVNHLKQGELICHV